VAALLGEARLLTLTGAGGAGKTRLAQAVGWAVLERYRDGVWLASLAALTDPALVLATIAGALGVHEQPGQALLTTLLAATSGREQLLIVDNCEHLLEASARLIETLLEQSPTLTVLATSRAPLRLRWEHEFPVAPLVLPPARREGTRDDARLEAVGASPAVAARSRACSKRRYLPAIKSVVSLPSCKSVMASRPEADGSLRALLNSSL